MKLQGFELEVDGEREDIPAITAAVQQQFAGLLQPSENIADGKQFAPVPATIEGESRNKSRNGTRKRSPRVVSGEPTDSQIVGFRHDPEKFGNPQQGWTVTQKCIWLLYVLSGSGLGEEQTASQLTATFNGQFKAAGKLHPPNVTRYLDKAKIGNPAPLGEDQGKWYLTTEGKRQAQELVQQCLTPNS